MRTAEIYRPKGNGEWKALLSALFGLLVLAGLVAGGFALFHYLPPTKGGNGTLKIDVDKGAEVKYGQCQMQILDSEGNVKKTLGPTQWRYVLPPGDYSASLEGKDSDGLALQIPDLGGEKGHKVKFKIDSHGEVSIKVIAQSAGTKTDSSKDLKERNDK
jgi:hypothetical protein